MSLDREILKVNDVANEGVNREAQKFWRGPIWLVSHRLYVC